MTAARWSVSRWFHRIAGIFPFCRSFVKHKQNLGALYLPRRMHAFAYGILKPPLFFFRCLYPIGFPFIGHILPMNRDGLH
jgi:hypothetical protein